MRGPPPCRRCLLLLLLLLAAAPPSRGVVRYITHEDIRLASRGSEADFVQDSLDHEEGDVDADSPSPVVLSAAATPSGPHDIAIVSWAIGQSETLRRQLSERNHRRYAHLHGYAFHNGSDVDAAAILHLMDPASWAKLYLVKRYLERYAVVVWLDSDTLVMNMRLHVERWVAEMGERSLLVSADWCQYLFNMGVAVFRRSAWTLDIIDRTLRASTQPKVRYDGAWEQNSMNRAYRYNALDRAHIHVIVDAHRFQAQLKWDEYVPGDWLVHNTWCPRNSILTDRPMPARRSAWWDREDCDRLFVDYFCMATPEDCPCSNSSAPRWSVWRLARSSDDNDWLKPAMEDVCRDNIARELSDPKGREPHPVCGDWCGGCLPGQKRARWTSQYQVLGPSWHRNRTLRYLQRKSAWDDDSEDEQELTWKRRRSSLRQWRRQQHSRYLDDYEEDDLPYYWLIAYGAIAAALFHLYKHYRQNGLRTRSRNKLLPMV